MRPAFVYETEVCNRLTKNLINTKQKQKNKPVEIYELQSFSLLSVPVQNGIQIAIILHVVVAKMSDKIYTNSRCKRLGLDQINRLGKVILNFS